MALPSKICLPPSPPFRNYLHFFWWPLTITATPQLMINRKWYQASKPEMECIVINMMYAALPRHKQTEKTTFSCKDDCILTKHTRRWTYSPLRLQYDLCRSSFTVFDWSTCSNSCKNKSNYLFITKIGVNDRFLKTKICNLHDVIMGSISAQRTKQGWNIKTNSVFYSLLNFVLGEAS